MTESTPATKADLAPLRDLLETKIQAVDAKIDHVREVLEIKIDALRLQKDPFLTKDEFRRGMDRQNKRIVVIMLIGMLVSSGLAHLTVATR